MAYFIQILLVILSVGSLGIVLGYQAVPIGFAVLDQVMGDFPYGFLLFFTAFGASGDEGVGNHVLQCSSVFAALSLVQKALDVVGGQPVVGQDGIDVDVVVFGGVTFTFGDYGHQ